MVKIVFERMYLRADVEGLSAPHVVIARSYRHARSIMKRRSGHRVWDVTSDGKVCDMNAMIVH